jgi:hypothetical protein
MTGRQKKPDHFQFGDCPGTGQNVVVSAPKP